MFAIQPPNLLSAAQMLPAIDPAGEPAGDSDFEAQFSALLAGAGPSAMQTLPANAPAQPALQDAPGGKKEAASGKQPGKQDGNILPDALAALLALAGEDDEAPAAPESSAKASSGDGLAETAPPPPALTLQLVIAQIALPAGSQQAIAPGAAAPAETTGPADARPARWLAVASTAPATATSAMPGAPAGGATLPPAVNEPAPAAQSAKAAVPPEASTPTIPAIRIPLALAVPNGMAPRQQQGEILAVIAENEAPAPPAQVVLQPVVQAQAASLALVQQSAKGDEPAMPSAKLDASSAQTSSQAGGEPSSAGPEPVVSVPQPLAAPAAAAAPITASSNAAAQPHDFAALIDRLVEARQAVQASLTSQTVQASVQHADFGRVSLAFQQDPAGLTVSFANPDPDLARAVQNLAPGALSTDIRPADAGAASQRQDGQRQDGQRQDWQGGGAATSGQMQGQSQGQLSAQQQRGQSPQREPSFGSAAQDRPAGNDDEAHSSARSGIFA